MAKEKQPEEKDKIVLDIRAKRVSLDDTITVREAEGLISISTNKDFRYLVSIENISDGSSKNRYALDNAYKSMEKLIETVRGEAIPSEVRLTYTFNPIKKESQS